MTVFSQVIHREQGVGMEKAALFWEEESRGMRRSLSFVPVHRESAIKHFILGDVEHQHYLGCFVRN